MAYNSSLKSDKIEDILQKVDDIETNRGGVAGKSDILAKDNTEVFTPTGDYQPATKKYADGVSEKVYAEITSGIVRGNTGYGNTVTFGSITVRVYNKSNRAIQQISMTRRLLVGNSLQDGGTWVYSQEIGPGESVDINYPSSSGLIKNTQDSIVVGKMFVQAGIIFDPGIYDPEFLISSNIIDFIVAPSSKGSSGTLGTLKDQCVILTESEYADLGSAVNSDGILYCVVPD